MDDNNHNERSISDILNGQQLNDENHNTILIEGSIITDESIGDIKVGTTFSIWEDAEIKLNQYAKFSGFSLKRKRVEVDDKNGVVQHKTFECSFSGKTVSNQVIDIIYQRERVSKKIMCPWHINLTKPKSSTEIVASFSDQYIHKRDLYNAIQKFKSPLTNRHGDAQNTINKLFELKDHEPGWIIYTRLDPFDNRFVGLF
ncbi:unnamed protein product [Rhizophagus irregularis]|nr:unnamed protein product [Rhizophagus irregularis]